MKASSSSFKAQDLRAGNWVLAECPGYRYPEDAGWNEVQITFRDLADGDSQEFCEVFKPIELTEEWLERFGFQKLTDGNGTYELEATVENKLPFDLRWTKENGFKLGEMTDHCYSEWHQHHIKYVHQVMNLYHALTQTELTSISAN